FKLATEAAPQSPWGKVLNVFKLALEAKTGGAYTIDFYFNATQGPEPVVVDKLMAGTLDFAAVSMVGLDRINPRLSAMQLPGVVHSWNNLDNVRTKMSAVWDGYINAAGVTRLCWGDVGYARILSHGYAVHAPADLRGHRPWLYRSEPNASALFMEIGGVASFGADPDRVQSGLTTGAIDALRVPMLAAEMYQWSAQVDHAIDDVLGVSAGAVLMSTQTLSKLPPDVQTVITVIGAKMATSGSGMTALARAEDDAAWMRFKARSGTQVYALIAADRVAWDSTYAAATRSLVVAHVYDSALVARVTAAAP
ncbi:MAG: TRAP transporter substrate-binding protein DctP, partial [Polyangiales bacterium]